MTLLPISLPYPVQSPLPQYWIHWLHWMIKEFPTHGQTQIKHVLNNLQFEFEGHLQKVHFLQRLLHYGFFDNDYVIVG